MSGAEIAGGIGDAIAAILAAVGIWASPGLGRHPPPRTDDSKDGLYTKSKTEVLQDLVGIISAIGLAFALLTLVTGDPFGSDKSTNLTTYLDHKLNSLSSPISPGYALCNVGLLVLMTFRFYYFNARYLANTYGLHKLEQREWKRFLFPDIPFILLEGLTFAALGLLVNHAALFFAGLAFGLLADTGWNMIQLVRYRRDLREAVLVLRERFDHSWRGSSDEPQYVEARAATWGGICSAVNNAVGGGCVAIMLIFGFIARHSVTAGWSTLAYCELVVLIVLNCVCSIFGYNLRYLLEKEL